MKAKDKICKTCAYVVKKHWYEDDICELTGMKIAPMMFCPYWKQQKRQPGRLPNS